MTVHVYSAGESLASHAHAEPHLVIVLSGAFVDISAGVERRCSALTVLLRRAGEIHENHFRSSTYYASVPVPDNPQATAAASLAGGSVAARLGLHPVRFTRLVERACGRTPTQLRNEIRIRRACDAIRNTRCSLAEIAIVCGFYDQSQMTNIFRRVLGVTPREYRENSSKNSRRDGA